MIVRVEISMIIHVKVVVHGDETNFLLVEMEIINESRVIDGAIEVKVGTIMRTLNHNNRMIRISMIHKIMAEVAKIIHNNKMMKTMHQSRMRMKQRRMMILVIEMKIFMIHMIMETTMTEDATWGTTTTTKSMLEIQLHVAMKMKLKINRISFFIRKKFYLKVFLHFLTLKCEFSIWL